MFTLSSMASPGPTAAEAVGSNPKGALEIPPIGEQIAGLPPAAGPLKRILESEPVRKVIAKQIEFDAAARKARTSYDRTVLTILLLVVIAIALGAVSIVTPGPLLASTKAASEWLATALIYSCLLISLVLARRLTRKETFESWSEARGTAEYLRCRIFNSVLEAPASTGSGELPVLPLKLEYFRRYQLDMQRLFHAERAGENAWLARLAKWLIIPCGLIVAFWVAALAAEIASARAEQSPLPDFVPEAAYHAMSFMQGLVVQYADVVWLIMGVVAASIYGAVFLLTLLNSSLRNAKRFGQAGKNFEYLSGEPLAAARAAAAAGNETAVLQFVSRVHEIMATESTDWVNLRKLETGTDL